VGLSMGSFHMVAQGRTPAQRAHRYVRLSPQQQAVFMDNVMSAYAALEEEAVGGGREAGVGGGRVRGAQYNRLLEMLLQDLPPGLVRTLLRVLYRDDRDTLELAEFAGGVKACLLFEGERFQHVLRPDDAAASPSVLP
jgi:hypothetical protein